MTPAARLNRLLSSHGLSVRSFTSSPGLGKKGGKAAREASRSSDNSSKSSSGAAATAPAASADAEDPFDFSALEADLARSVERLKADLSKLRAGGRFNPDVLEALRVTLGKSKNEGGGGGGVVKLGDVAQVVPKGRTVQVLVGETEHVKPITSTIQSSSLNLTPQPDPTGANPLLLLLHIPPPTAESRNAALAQAAKAGETAGLAIRNARQVQQKKLRQLQLAKSARPDDLKKAGQLMEKVVEKGAGEVKRIVDGARKVLDS
ncbi:hypothetical protein MBLNU459_g7527t2 [Dothideomycetes sp. NU459]